MGRKPGVRIVGNDQFSLAVLQKFGASDGSAVDDLDPYIRVILVEPAKIRNQEVAA